MIKGHRIERKISVDKFLDIIKSYTEEQIITTEHTFFRLNEEERKIFKESVLKEYLTSKVPILVGIQYNLNYAVFYDYDKQKALRIIIDIKPDKIKIVTFYLPEKSEMPRI
ncbi:hypothetical protein HYX00_01915 [Candidatus Woesearchaeota archaeon]|nr:hypothetical protein [Candidatus Woesearchaeota archaeon]